MKTGLCLHPSARWHGRWWPAGASFAADFAHGRVQLAGRPVAGLQAIPGLSAAGGVNGLYGPAPRIGETGLLLEGERTNLLSQSEDLSHNAWQPVISGTGSPPSRTPGRPDPFGGARAYRLQADRGADATSANSAQLYQSAAVSLPDPHDVSGAIWMKSNTAQVQNVYFSNLSNGTGATSVDVGPQWARYSFTALGVAGTSDGLRIGARGGLSADQAVDIDVFGAQLELGASASSYIATAGGAVTRTADSVTFTDLTALGLTGAAIDAGFTLVVGWRQDLARPNAYLFQADDGTGNERVAALANGANATLLEARVVSGGVNTWSGGVSDGAAIGARRAAFRYAPSGAAISVAGVAPAKVAATPMPASLNRLRLGRFQTPFAAASLADVLETFAILPVPVSDAELQMLSA